MWNANAGSGLSVVRVSSLRELEGHAPQYSQLVARLHGLESLYYSLSWMEAVSPLYENCGVRMCFLLVYRHQDLIGVAPFQTEARGVLWPKFVKLQFWGAVDCYAKNVHQNILCANDQDRDGVLECLADYLLHNNGICWDVMQFQRVNLKETCVREFVGRFHDGVIEKNPLKSYCFRAPATIDERLSRKERWAIRDAEKRMARDFSSYSVRLMDSFTDGELNCMTWLHTRRQKAMMQKGVSRDAFMDDPRVLAAIERLTRHFHSQGKVRCYQLVVEEAVIAFLLMFADKGEAWVLITAFDDRYHRYQPSRYLWYAAFKHEMEVLGTRLIDTAYGETVIKRDFSTDVYDLHDIEIWRTEAGVNAACRTMVFKGTRNMKAHLRGWSRINRDLWSRISFCGCMLAFL